MQRKFLVAICLTVFLSCLAMVANMNRVSAMVLEPKVTADIAGTYRISQVWKFKYGRYDDKVVDPLRNFVGRIVRVETDDCTVDQGYTEYNLIIVGYVVPEPNDIDPEYLKDKHGVTIEDYEKEEVDIEYLVGQSVLSFWFNNQYNRDSNGGGGHLASLEFLKDKYSLGVYVVIKPDSLLFYHYGDYGHMGKWNFVENMVREPVLELKRIE